MQLVALRLVALAAGERPRFSVVALTAGKRPRFSVALLKEIRKAVIGNAVTFYVMIEKIDGVTRVLELGAVAASDS